MPFGFCSPFNRPCRQPRPFPPAQGEARALLHTAPPLFCYSAQTLLPKLRKLEEELGLSAREVLLHHPESLSRSLNRGHRAAREEEEEEEE